jgi:hypothetical protein
MAQEGASTNHEPTVGLFFDLQRSRSEAEREEGEASASEDIQKADYWRGRRNGLEYALMKLIDSGWRPPNAEAYPDEEFVLSVEVLVSRKTGNVTSVYGGKWDDHEEFEDAFDLLGEAAREIVKLNPEEYVTDPAPRTVQLRHESIPAMDTWGEPLMLSELEAAASKFIYDDGQFVFLTLLDGQTVRVERVDVDVELVES